MREVIRGGPRATWLRVLRSEGAARARVKAKDEVGVGVKAKDDVGVGVKAKVGFGVGVWGWSEGYLRSEGAARGKLSNIWDRAVGLPWCAARPRRPCMRARTRYRPIASAPDEGGNQRQLEGN